MRNETERREGAAGPQAGSDGSPQAGNSGSAQACSDGSPQAGSDGSAQAGSGGSPQGADIRCAGTDDPVRERHIRLLRRCVDLSIAAKAAGNHPFGALLADADGNVLMEQGNVEVTEGGCGGHAETALLIAASKRYSKAMLRTCALYTTAEPCAMCAGAAYWAGVGRVVYGISERRLAELTGDDERNLTLDLPCRTVFASGRRDVEVTGPFPELEEAIVAPHRGHWR